MKVNFNQDWKFYLGNLAPHTSTEGWSGAKAKANFEGATAISLDDSKWRSVTLPHDYVSEGEYTRKSSEENDMRAIPEMESIDSRLFAAGSLEGGIGWYRKHFELDMKLGQRVLLHFDGVYRNCTIYINEYFVQMHSGGYDSFIVDATDFVNLQGENLIAVRVDATGREGWWYEGGGIYRNVWLEVKEEVYVEPWGVQITYDLLDHQRAALTINTEVTSKAFTDKKLRIRHHFIEQNGSAEEDFCVEAWETQKITSTVTVDDITLWDLEQPHLYKVCTELYDGNVLVDQTETTIGFRSLTFDADKGFFLNGKHVKIQGLCCHQDHAGVGIACYEDIWEYRLQQMKSMGMNAYRSAHHMMTPEVLALCDKLGILVMGETRRMSSAPEDLEALRTLVKTSRNHPSVFMWSIGNEEIFSQDKPETIRTTMTMKAIVNKLDGTRPITSAVVCWNGAERFDTAERYEEVTQHLDVMGFNYCKTAWDSYHASKPKQPIIVTEASANSWTRGCYETNEDIGQYYIFDPENETKCKSGKKSVRKDMAEQEWKYVADRDFLMGTFLWTGMDYRGEPTPVSYPAVYSNFGIMDYCGFEKDNYYYWKSWWQKNPVLHLFPHWNHPGKEGKPITVYAYSNADEVELFINGVSQGRKEMEKNGYLFWENVIYQPGELSAKGYQNGQIVAEEKVETTHCGYQLVITPVKESIEQGGIAMFNLDVRDDKGRFVPTANPLIHIKVTGGEFLGTGNGNQGDHDSEKRPVRRAFHGRLQVIVRATESGKITLAASSEEMIGAEGCVMVEKKTFYPEAYGAVGDGVTKDTVPIQRAMDAAATQGGRVFLSGKTYLSGTLFLKSNVTLHLEEGAKLLGSGDTVDYPIMRYRWEGEERDCYASLINTANGQQENICITGKGTIDANGKLLFRKEMDEKKGFRGRAVCLRNTKGVVVEGVTIRQSPAWCLHLIYCENIHIKNVEIHTKYDEQGKVYTDIFNGDGMDIDSCKHVLIEDSMIASQDDNIAIKSGRDAQGRMVGIPTENVEIRNCVFRYGFGVAMGSEMSGGIKNVYVHDCDFQDTYSFASVKAKRGRGGVIEDITYKNITHYNHSKEHQDCKWFRGSLYVDLYYSVENEEIDILEMQPITEETPTIRNIHFENVISETTAGNGLYLCGLAESPLENVTLQNVKIKALHTEVIQNVKELIMQEVETEVIEG